MKNPLSGLRGYLLLICLPAIVAGAFGFVSVCRLQHDDLRRRRDNWRSRLRGVVERARPEKFAKSPHAVFLWSPGRGITAAARLPPEATRVLTDLRGPWPLNKAKNAKTGIGEIGGVAFGWRPYGDGIIGCATQPFEMTDDGAGTGVLAAGSVTVVALLAALAAGGFGLARAARRAREADALKSMFVADVSHELKMPLATIRLWTEMLINGRLPTPEKVRHAYAVIAEENLRLIRMVENLLDAGRLDRGRKVYRPEPLALDELVADAVASLGRAAVENGLRLETAAHATALADRDAVKQIVLNLIGNALKYAAAGGPVEVTVAAGSVVVADRGPGLSPEGLERCFERFWRAGDATSAATGGFGLGLAISRELARGMHGDLTAAARPGGGCVFALTLPAAESAAIA